MYHACFRSREETLEVIKNRLREIKEKRDKVLVIGPELKRIGKELLDLRERRDYVLPDSQEEKELLAQLSALINRRRLLGVELGNLYNELSSLKLEVDTLKKELGLPKTEW